MSAESLSHSGPQALQALLNSVAPHEAPGDKLSSGSLQALADKINQLIPEGSGPSGQLVNEEGLPIIEVTEPSNNISGTATGNSVISDETPLPPLSSLSSEERDARAKERNRILDLLEEEERQEQKKERAQITESHKKELEQRRQASEEVAARLKAKKELQKKMGKALMKQMSEAKEVAEKAKKEAEQHDLLSDQARRDDRKGPQKKVSFANLSDADSPSEEQSKNRLRSPDIPKPKSSQGLPMKSFVVERTPSTSQPAKAQFQSSDAGDSDDESDPEEPPSSSDSGSEDGEDDDGDAEFDDEAYDLDQAAHHREIAADYYRRKGTIGADAHAAMTSHSHSEPDGDVPDPSLRPPAKPSISRFKAEKLASAYNTSAPNSKESLSLGSSILPESATQTLQKAVRMGKLDNEDRLVGEADDSSEDEDPAVREILDLLKKGQVENVGPSAGGQSSTKLPPVPPLPAKPKTSQFKIARSQPSRRSETPDASSSSSAGSQKATPTTSLSRSSPKTASPGEPGIGPTVVPKGLEQDYIPPSVAPDQDPFSMVVASPSFPSPGAQSSRPPGPPAVMTTTVVERAPAAKNSSAVNSQQTKKVSRFMASRES